MELDPTGYYRMPLLMGPLFKGEKPQLLYKHAEIVALQYLTDPAAIAPLLPRCYRPGKVPLVTILFGYNNGLDFVPGGSYRLAAVQVSARYDGEADHVEGDYVLVMFENKTWPIIGGREDLGIPKLYADISSIKTMENNHLRCEASFLGHLLFGLDFTPPKKQNRLVKSVATHLVNASPWLGYKYIPSLDGPPDAAYPTISKNDTTINDLWFARTGRAFFGDAETEDVGQIKTLIETLKTLSVKKVKRALRFQGSTVLRYDLSRRLV